MVSQAKVCPPRRRAPTTAVTDVDHIENFVTQLRAARLAPAQATAASAFALINWLLDAACLAACLQAVGGGAGLVDLLLAFCAGMAASTLTLVPGGLGIIDSALIFGLLTAGVATSTVIAAVVLYRIISFGVIIGTGWIFWLLIRHRDR
ncbi:flippase-like domain-containing protein [Microbispora hainanensis]|uniref:lysylphosphatidylglycerol synthase transmembrane domain-containing protein n=1 Tax=Microbispora hainanensis TaxID=568844 RepID=UPI0033FBB4FE